MVCVLESVINLTLFRLARLAKTGSFVILFCLIIDDFARQERASAMGGKRAKGVSQSYESL